jgi:hypothetical protein
MTCLNKLITICHVVNSLIKLVAIAVESFKATNWSVPVSFVALSKMIILLESDELTSFLLQSAARLVFFINLLKIILFIAHS